MASTTAHAEFFQELDRRIARFDLLCHPFYKAWEAGELTREDLREYAAAYYPQVSAFPTYLSTLHARMEDGEARRAVLRNLAGEEIQGRAHSELWLDFAEDMGAERIAARTSGNVPEIGRLVEASRETARTASTAEAMASFYAYESQVPRIAVTKARGLQDHYQASARGTRYFTLHATADIQHAGAWRTELARQLDAQPELAGPALAAAEHTAEMLWQALDGIELQRQARKAA